MIEFKLLNEHALAPRYATPGSAGIDLVAAIPAPITVYPGDNELILTGIAVSINDINTVGILCSRSGMGLTHRMRLGNGVGVIDSDYQHEIGVILYNDGDAPYYVNPGARIAQLVFVPVITTDIMVVSEFSVKSDRGGFGHTGV